MPQECYGRPPELAFAGLGVELVMTQRLEDHATGFSTVGSFHTISFHFIPFHLPYEMKPKFMK
jgi:hypothetical protein